MRYLVWLLKAAVFFAVFAFALNNLGHVRVHFFFGHHTDTPLVVVLLGAVVAGLVLGLLVMLPYWWRWRHLQTRPTTDAADSTLTPPPMARTDHGT